MTQRRSRGALEDAVLRALWGADHPLTARQVRDRIGTASSGDGTVLALTTVLTVLDRLRGKGWVDKVPAAGGFEFSPVTSESGFTAEAMVRTLMAATDRDAALLGFAGRLDRRDVDLLRQALGGDPCHRAAGHGEDRDGTR